MNPSAAGKRRTPRRVAAIGLLSALLGMLLVLGAGAPSFAHAELLGTTPEDGAVLEAAPAQVELRFNEPVQVVEGAIRLFPGGGDPVALDARTVDTTVIVELPAGLGDDAYALAYRIVSADGHPVGGAISFQVGEGDYAAPDAAEAPADPVVTETIVSLLTAVQYLGLLAFAGLLFFERVVVRAPHPGRRGARRISRIAFGAALAASLLLVPASGTRVGGAEFVSYLPETGDLVFLAAEAWLPGVSWQLPVTALLVAAGGLAALIVDARTGAARARARIPILAGGIAALAAPQLIGHTQTVQPVWVMLAADLGHLLTGAFWVGGVIGLLCYLAAARPAAGESAPRVPPRTAAAVVSRFSRAAPVSVVVLAVSGTVMAVLIVGSWGALLGSGYGRLLLLKLGLVAVVVLVAAWNRFRLLPAITRYPGETRQWAALRRTLLVEAVVLIAVIVVTGFLTNTSPGTDHEHRRAAGSGITAGTGAPPAGDAVVRAESQGLAVDGILSPAAAGENTLVFRLEYEGAPVEDVEVEDLTVEALLPEQELGPFAALPSLDADTGEYTAELTLPVAGDWQIRILARIDTYTQPIVIVPVTIP